MATGRLFATALVYLVNQWLVSRLHKRPLQLITNADGDEDGELRHRFIKVEKTLSGRATEVTFHYVESSAGNGKCVVFLHGFMDTWRLWRHQLASYADRHHLVAFDLKGTGQSSMNYPQRLFPEVHDAGGDYSLDMQAEELVTALDAQGVRYFDLVTLDLGTIIGDILAGKYPERIGHYMRCQQPVVGHFRSSIPQGRILRSRGGARLLTAMLEAVPSSVLRLLYGRTGWPLLDDAMRRTKCRMTDADLEDVNLLFTVGFQY